MSSYYFNKEDIRTFTFKDLDGKTLKIKTTESIDGEITVGKDIEDGNIYVLNMNINVED